MAENKNDQSNNWTEKLVLMLIGHYETKPVLWDKTHKGYKSELARLEALDDISEAISVPACVIRKKVRSLRCQFNAEVRKLKNAAAENGSTDYLQAKSEWKYYKYLRFLDNNFTKRTRGRPRRTEEPAKNMIADTIEMTSAIDIKTNIDKTSSDQDGKYPWTVFETLQLIDKYRNVPLLWNFHHHEYKDMKKRSLEIAKLARELRKPVAEVERKIYCLRSQFVSEVKKIKKREENNAKLGYDKFDLQSQWTFFDRLSFLTLLWQNEDCSTLRESDSEDSNSQDNSNSNRDFEVSVKMECEPDIIDIEEHPVNRSTLQTKGETQKMVKEVPTSTRNEVTRDEDRIFGEYVASELRLLSKHNADKLKLMIKKAIVEVSEDEYNLQAVKVKSEIIDVDDIKN